MNNKYKRAIRRENTRRKRMNKSVVEAGRRKEYLGNKTFPKKEEIDLEIERSKMKPPLVYVENKDNLGAARRWLESKVGQYWDTIYSEICERFPKNTIARHHILHTHILNEVDTDSSKERRFPRELYVNKVGILCKRKVRKLTKEYIAPIVRKLSDRTRIVKTEYGFYRVAFISYDSLCESDGEKFIYYYTNLNKKALNYGIPLVWNSNKGIYEFRNISIGGKNSAKYCQLIDERIIIGPRVLLKSIKNHDEFIYAD